MYILGLIFEDDVQGVNQAREETKDSQGNIDEKVDAAATLEEYTNGRQDDGKDDLANVGSGERHDGGFVTWKVFIMCSEGFGG